MASPFEDVVSGFDLQFLTPTTEISEPHCRHRDQRKAIKRVKMRTIATDAIIRKYEEMKIVLEKTEKNLSESRDECKNTYIEYTNALQKVTCLEDQAKQIQDFNDDLQKKNFYAENQCSGLQSNAKQLQIMIKELQNKIEALEIENHMAKTTPKDVEKKLSALQNDKEVMLKHILILRNVVFGKKQLDRSVKAMLRKYEKLCNDISIYDDTDEFIHAAEDTEPSWTDAVDSKVEANQEQEASDSDAVITQIVMETLPDPETIGLESEMETLALTADITVQKSGQLDTPCFTADIPLKDSHEICDRDRDSEDTGRGSSLAFSGSDKSPEYINHVSPMSPESIFRKNISLDAPGTISRSTSPIVFEDTLNNALRCSPIQTKRAEVRDVATSPVPCETDTVNSGKINPKANKKLSRSPVEQVTPEFMKSLDEITKPLYTKPPVKIVEDKGIELELSHSDILYEEETRDDSEVTTILDNINLHYNLITPIPVSPKTVHTPKRSKVKSSPTAAQITEEEINHFRKMIPDLQNHISVLTKLVNRTNLCNTLPIHKPIPRPENMVDIGAHRTQIDKPEIVIEYVDDSTLSVPILSELRDVDTRKATTAKSRRSCDVDNTEDIISKFRRNLRSLEIDNSISSVPVITALPGNVSTEDITANSRRTCDVDNTEDIVAKSRRSLEIYNSNMSVPVITVLPDDVSTEDITANCRKTCDVDNKEDIIAKGHRSLEIYNSNLSVPVITVLPDDVSTDDITANSRRTCDVNNTEDIIAKSRRSLEIYNSNLSVPMITVLPDDLSTEDITANSRISCDVDNTEDRTEDILTKGRKCRRLCNIDNSVLSKPMITGLRGVDTSKDITVISRSFDVETRTAKSPTKFDIDTTEDKRVISRISFDLETKEYETSKNITCDVDNAEDRTAKSRMQLIFGDTPLSDDDDDEPLVLEKDRTVVDVNPTLQQYTESIHEKVSNTNDTSSNICDNDLNFDDVSINGLVREHRKKTKMSKLEKMRKRMVPKNKIKASETPKKRLRGTTVQSVPPRIMKTRNGATSALLNDKTVYAKAVAVVAELRAQQKTKIQTCNQNILQKRPQPKTGGSDNSETHNKQDEFENNKTSTNAFDDIVTKKESLSFSKKSFDEYMEGHDIIRENKKLLSSSRQSVDDKKGEDITVENNNWLSSERISKADVVGQSNNRATNNRQSFSELSPLSTITTRSRSSIVPLTPHQQSPSNSEDKQLNPPAIINTTQPCVDEIVLGCANQTNTSKIEEKISCLKRTSPEPLQTETKRRLRNTTSNAMVKTSQKNVEQLVLDTADSMESPKSQPRRSSLKRPSPKLPERQTKRRLRSTSLRLSITEETQHKTFADDVVESPVLDSTERRTPQQNYSDLDMFTTSEPDNEPKYINVPKPEVKRDVAQNQNSVNDSIMCKMIGKYSRKTYKKKYLKLSEKAITAVCTKLEEAIETIKDQQQSSRSTVEMNRLVDTVKSYDHKIFLSGLMKYLKNPDRKTELFMKCNLPSVPGMGKSEQILLYLVSHLKGNWPSIDLVDEILQNIEYAVFRLNCAPEFDVIESMSHFYAVLCRYTGNRNRLRMFMLDAMYCIGYKAMPLVRQCLDVWMHVLPLAHMGTAKNPVVTVLVFLLHFYKCEDRFNRVTEIRRILQKQFFYNMAEWSEQKLLDLLRNSILELRDIPVQQMMLRISLIILAKRQGTHWCVKTLFAKVIMPIIEKEGVSETSLAFCLSLLGALVKPFSPDMKVHCEIVMNQLFGMLGHTRPQRVEEAIFTSLLNMSKHNRDRVTEALLAWRPKYAISQDLEILLKSFVREKTTNLWKNYLQKFALKHNNNSC